jgi:hypothetical protein
MKVAPNGPIYLLEKYHIFQRLLTISSDLIPFCVIGKMVFIIWNLYSFPYRAGPTHPKLPAHQPLTHVALAHVSAARARPCFAPIPCHAGCSNHRAAILGRRAMTSSPPRTVPFVYRPPGRVLLWRPAQPFPAWAASWTAWLNSVCGQRIS